MDPIRTATSASFALSGLLFVLYPAIRPFSSETGLAGAAAFGSTSWIVAHSLAIVAFVLLVLGLLGVFLVLQQRLMLIALVISWIGVGLTLPFYGAEVFGLHAIGQVAITRQDPSLVALAADVRGEPGIWFIVIGLLLLGVGMVLFAVAAWRSRILIRWIAIPLAAAFALYLPQFTTPQPVRVAHGLLVAAGCWLVAWNVLSSRSPASS